jgi:hypothetical protein
MKQQYIGKHVTVILPEEKYNRDLLYDFLIWSKTHPIEKGNLPMNYAQENVEDFIEEYESITT